MLTPDEISQQQGLLEMHRRTLAHLIRQAAKFGGAAFSPPATMHGIHEARTAIDPVKAILRESGVEVQNQPNDEAQFDDNVGPPQLLGFHQQHTQSISDTAQIGIAISGNVYGDIINPSQPREREGSPFSIPSPRLAVSLVGRDNLIATIGMQLCGSVQVRLALTGLPGVGKTSLTLMLACDDQICHHFGGGVLMTSLGQNPDLSHTLRRWLAALGVSIDQRATVEEQFQRLTDRLNRTAKPVLLIIDDVWRIEDGQPFLLSSPYTSVLFTGRQRDTFHAADLGDLVGSQQVITIPLLDEGQAVELLRQSAEIPAPAYQYELEALAALVGSLPLLLDAMGRYLRDQRGKHQERWFKAALAELHSAAARLNLSTRPIEQARANLRPSLLSRFRRKQSTTLPVRDIIALSVAVLPGDAQAAFVRLAALPPEPLTFGVDSAYAAAEATNEILRLLVRRNLLTEVDDNRFSCHRVLWDWAEDHDSRAVRSARRLLADWHANLVSVDYADAFGEWRKNPDNWQHMLKTWDEAVRDANALQGAINTILPMLIDQGYARDVVPGLLSALEAFRRVDHTFSALLRYYLGSAYYELATYDQAREYLLVARTGFQEQRLTSWHATVLSLLGLVELATGRYDQAKDYLEDSFALIPETDTRRHAAILNNLGSLLHAQGDLASARPYYEQALAINQAVLGEKHPDTARSLNNLGALLRAQGDLSGAHSYYEQALAIYREMLGMGHPDTASSLNNLGILLQSQGDLPGAHSYYEQVLALRRELLGERHPDTALSLNNLGGLLDSMGDLTSARPYYEQALAIYRAVLGERHPDTARSLNNLGALLRAQGDLTGARPYLEQALAINLELLGERHPDTARSLNNLGLLLQSQGDLADARPYYERALAIREQALGPQHPDTASSLWWLGGVLAQEGNWDGAREHLQRATAIYRHTLGEQHPTTQECQRQLAALDTPPQTPEQQIADNDSPS